MGIFLPRTSARRKEDNKKSQGSREGLKQRGGEKDLEGGGFRKITPLRFLEKGVDNVIGNTKEEMAGHRQ